MRQSRTKIKKTFWPSAELYYPLRPACLSLMFLRLYICTLYSRACMPSARPLCSISVRNTKDAPKPLLISSCQKALTKRAHTVCFENRSSFGTVDIRKQKKLPRIVEHWTDLKLWPLALYSLHMLQCFMVTGGRVGTVPRRWASISSCLQTLHACCEMPESVVLHTANSVCFFIKL